MGRSSPPQERQEADAVALQLLNRLRAAFASEPLAAPDKDAELVRELREAHPLLVMLAPRASDPAAPPELLDELRHNWNKAVRRRGWRHLPKIEGPVADATANAARAQAFLDLFGLRLPAAQCSPEALADAAALAGLLEGRLEALRSPPLPGPAEYGRELAAVAGAWNELVARHPGLPRIE